MLWTRDEFDEFWRKELRYNDIRVKRATKIAIAGLVCTGLGLFFQLQMYHWMLVTVFVIMMPATVGGTLEKSVLRIFGTATGAIFGIWIVGSLVQHHLLFTVVIYIYFTGCFYFGTGKIFAYSFMIAGITAVLVAVGAIERPEDAVSIAANRSFEICLGIIVSAVVTLAIWPVYARDLLRSKLSGTAQDCASLVRGVSEHLLSARDIDLDFVAREDAIIATFSADFSMLHDAASEDSTYRYWSEEYTGLILHFESILARLKAARRACMQGMDKGLHLEAREEIAAYLEAVATRLDQLAGDLNNGLTASRMGPVREAAERMQQRVDALREEGVQYGFSTATNRHFNSFLTAMYQVVEGIEQAEAMIISLQHHRRDRSDLPAPSPVPVMFSPSTWQQIFSYDRDRLRHGVKAGFAFLILFFLGQTGFLPYSTPTLVSATVILIVTSVGGASHKALQRLLGCVVGGSVALLAVALYFPQFQSVMALMILTACILFSFGYIAIGDAKYSYAGFQMAIAYFITVFDSFGPPDSLIPPVERLWGVIFGAGVSLAVLTWLWPVRAYQQRRRILASVISRIARQLESCQLGRPPDTGDMRAHQNLHHTVIMQTQKAMSLCVEARFERRDDAERNASIASLIRAVQALFFALVSLEESLDRPMEPKIRDALKPAYESYRLRLIEYCDRFASELGAEVDRMETVDLSAELAGIEQVQDAMRATHATQGVPLARVGPAFNAMERLEQMGFVLGRAAAYAYAAYGPHRPRDVTGEAWRPVAVQPLAAARPQGSL